VLDKRLKGRSFIADDYSIADMAAYPWVLSWERQGQVLDDFPNIKAWLARMSAREGVQRGLSSALK
jgi:GST-like protein